MSDIVGRTARINGVPHQIIGVMPRGMRFPVISEIWLPSLLPTPRSVDRSARDIDVFARLQEGVSIRQAESDVQSIAGRLEAEHSETNKNIDVRVTPFAAQFENPRNRNATWALIAAVCFVLLIVCANLANLLVARAIDRTRETAIRLAIGASRWRVIRQLLLESLMLSFAGGVIGLGLAVSAIRVLSRLEESIRVSARLPFWITISVDYHVYLYTLGVCIVAGILFGLAPALQISRTSPNDALKEGAATVGRALRSRRLTGFLVTSEIALTFTLMVAAGLMIRSLVRFQTIGSEGSDPQTLVGSLVLTGARYPDARTRVTFLEGLLDRLQSMPGMASTTVATEIPTEVRFNPIHTQIVALPEVATVVVMPGYFRAMGAGILRGRDFDSRDGLPQRLAAIVNEQFASQQWPGEDPIGKRIRKGAQPDAPWLTVVGVSSNLQVEDSETPQGVVYTPYRQEPFPALSLIARSDLPSDQVMKTLRTEVQKADADLPVFNIMTMSEHHAQIGMPLKLFGWFFGLFGTLALLISIMGIYGVTAYTVSQRSREIGIRVALGATSQAVIWLVLRDALRQLSVGLVLGFAGAFALSRALSGMLFHTAPTDARTYAIIFIAFVTATVAACWIPAGRTARVDPTTSLRSQ
jgi:predicted permease